MGMPAFNPGFSARQPYRTGRLGAIIYVPGSGPIGSSIWNYFGMLSQGQKDALIAEEATAIIKAGGDPATAQALAQTDIANALIASNADPSQAGLAATFQAPVDTALTGSPMPSGTLYDTLVVGLPASTNPAVSWLSIYWPLLALAAGGFILYKTYA